MVRSERDKTVGEQRTLQQTITGLEQDKQVCQTTTYDTLVSTCTMYIVHVCGLVCHVSLRHNYYCV